MYIFSDNDSNSCTYGDPGVSSAFEVIEIDPSDDEDDISYPNDVALKFRAPTNGNCSNSSPSATSLNHVNPYESSGASGPEVVTTTNGLDNSNWYEDKVDHNNLLPLPLPPPPEVTIEQCRSGNLNNKMPIIESIIPVNNNNDSHQQHNLNQQQQQQQQHLQQQYSNSNSTLPLHMTPILSGGGLSGGVTVGTSSSGSGNNLTPEISYTNGSGGNVKDLINAEVTIEPISSGNRGANHHSHHFHHQSTQSQLMNNIIVNDDNRKLPQNNAIPPVLTPMNGPIELYCLSLVDCLRAMPRSERERVKFEFAKILKDAIYKDEA